MLKWHTKRASSAVTYWDVLGDFSLLQIKIWCALFLTQEPVGCERGTLFHFTIHHFQRQSRKCLPCRDFIRDFVYVGIGFAVWMCLGWSGNVQQWSSFVSHSERLRNKTCYSVNPFFFFFSFYKALRLLFHSFCNGRLLLLLLIEKWSFKSMLHDRWRGKNLASVVDATCFWGLAQAGHLSSAQLYTSTQLRRHCNCDSGEILTWFYYSWNDTDFNGSRIGLVPVKPPINFMVMSADPNQDKSPTVFIILKT